MRQSDLNLLLSNLSENMALRAKKDRSKKTPTKSVDIFDGTSKSPIEDDDGQIHCHVPLISCIQRGEPLPKTVNDGGVKMRCTNDKCQYERLLIHVECFEQLENTLIKIISNLGSARGWTDIQRRHNLWEKKGLTLVQKRLRCHCGLGLMIRDADFYKKLEATNNNNNPVVSDSCVSSTNTPALSITLPCVTSSERSKKKKKKDLPRLNYGYNSSIPPSENAQMYKKKFYELDTHFASHRDDSLEDASSSEFSSSAAASWRKVSFPDSTTPLQNNSSRVSLKSSSVICPWGKVNSMSNTPQTFSLLEPQPSPWATLANGLPSPLSVTTSLQGLKQENKPSPWSNALSTPLSVSSSQQASTSKQEQKSSTMLHSYDSNKQQPPKQTGYYTLFGQNSFSFLLGERILADLHLPRGNSSFM